MIYSAKISANYLDRGSRKIITINQAKHEQTKYIPANVYSVLSSSIPKFSEETFDQGQ